VTTKTKIKVRKEVEAEEAPRPAARLVRGDDGRVYAVEQPPGSAPEEDDEDRAGGVRLGRVGRRRVGGEALEVREVLTLAAGGSFRSIGGEPTPYKAPKDRPEALRRGYDLWKRDALGGAIVELTTTMTFGDGFRIKAAGLASEILAKFKAKNGLDTLLPDLSNESVAYGEIYLKLVPHKRDVPNPSSPSRPLWRRGQVQVVPICPEIVSAIDHSPTDVADVREYVLRYRDGPEDDPRAKVVEERWPPLDKFDPARDAACVLHVKFNAGSGDVFGSSELIRAEEWIGNYREFLRDGVVINKLYRSPCYDITIKDADDGEIRKAIRRYENWTIGANPVHNDKEEWSILEFSGANVSQEDSRRALLLMVAAGVTMPEFFFADASNNNLASGKTQLLPAVQKFKKRQQIFKTALERIFDFVLDMALLLGGVEGLDPGEDFEGEQSWDVEVEFPPIQVEKDLELAQANRVGLESGYMSPQSAAARAGLDYEVEWSLRKQAALDDARLRIEVAKEVEAMPGSELLPKPPPAGGDEEREEDEGEGEEPAAGEEPEAGSEEPPPEA